MLFRAVSCVIMEMHIFRCTPTSVWLTSVRWASFLSCRLLCWCDALSQLKPVDFKDVGSVRERYQSVRDVFELAAKLISENQRRYNLLEIDKKDVQGYIISKLTGAGRQTFVGNRCTYDLAACWPTRYAELVTAADRSTQRRGHAQ